MSVISFTYTSLNTINLYEKNLDLTQKYHQLTHLPDLQKDRGSHKDWHKGPDPSPLKTYKKRKDGKGVSIFDKKFAKVKTHGKELDTLFK